MHHIEEAKAGFGLSFQSAMLMPTGAPNVSVSPIPQE
jgi:hypothetical protein